VNEERFVLSGTSVRVRRCFLRKEVGGAVADMQARAPALDQSGTFPTEDIALLRRLGAFAASVPTDLGGLGLGTEPDAALDIMEILRLIGRGNLSVGRLYEAHVNALRLIMRDGTLAQRQRTAAAALNGALLGLWVTDAPDAPVVLSGDCVLQGTKSPCSGAGQIRHALVTARLASGATHMLAIELPSGQPVDEAAWPMQGMRAACNGRVSLDGIVTGRDAVIGEAGAYLRQPDFSAGAWRGMAVALGGMEALVGIMREMLVARGRADDPHQRVRIGEALIALETARMWVHRAALVAESGTGDPGDVANTVNLARIAVERAGLDILRLAQRGLGLAAFRSGALAELLMRDLATYLRQPAPDITLTDAAAHFTVRDLPWLPC
jgi:alkylation response protein AidB-like acyl-CoA dehydrogenase